MEKKKEYKRMFENPEYRLPITDDEHKKILDYFFKIDEFKIYKEIYDLLRGKNSSMFNLNKIFNDERFKTKYHTAVYSSYELLMNKELLGFAKWYVLKHKKDFYENKKGIEGKIYNFLQFKREFKLASVFPVKQAIKIYKKYNINGKIYDYSCGWGNRLTAALVLGLEYYGVDVNCKLIPKYYKLVEMFKKVTHKDYKVDIRCLSSEVFIPEWENKIGLAFSSPPYFNVELYPIEKQFESESDWNNYLNKTFENGHRYLIKNGIFAMNIKENKNGIKIDEIISIGEKYFKFIKTDVLRINNATRPIAKNKKISLNEPILIFKKV